jgi:hypothetical protein
MKTRVDSIRIGFFLLFGFGIVWVLDLVIHLKGGLASLSMGSLAWVLLTVSMAAPALAHLLTRWITREGWKDLSLRPQFKPNKSFWLYPGAPWLGAITFVWFTFIIGTFLGWLTLKAKSVWPAVIAHGSINGIAAIALLVVKGQPNPLLGPTVVGLLASLPFSFLVFWLLWRSDVFAQVIESPQQPEYIPVRS